MSTTVHTKPPKSIKLPITDRHVLQWTRQVYRRWPRAARRLKLMKRLGLSEPGHSVRWAVLGLHATRMLDHPYWMILDAGKWAQRLMYIQGRYYETGVSSLLEQHLKSGDIFIDIGANIGVHTLHAAHLVGPSGRCVAVEANPGSCAVLQGHIALNRITHVRVVCAAFASAEGELALHSAGAENLGTNLRPGCTTDVATITVPAYTGDRMLADIPATAAGVCKIDAEGFELHVLRGMNRFLREHRRFVYLVEVTDEWLRACGGSAHELFSLFRECGYRPSRIRGGVLEPLESPLLDEKQYDVAFHPCEASVEGTPV